MHEYRLTPASPANCNTPKQRRGSSSMTMRLDDWVLCRIHKKSNDFSSSDQQEEQDQPEGSTVEQQEDNNSCSELAPTSEHNEQPSFQPMAASSMSKSCSLTDLLNTIDCAALSQLLLDGSSDMVSEPPAPPSPLIYTNPCQTQTVLTYNMNNNNNIPSVLEARLDHHDGYVNNYHGLRRKRMMACSSGSTSFDDGREFVQQVAKKPLLPSGSRGSGFGGGYCNQQLAETTTTFQFQNGNLLSHPFPLNQQQLLLNNHLQMQ
uniref:NAC domain-containing protein n=1 Tax=Oryza brachyantha TaxID=4533 RepID=J3N5N6_ORYBR